MGGVIEGNPWVWVMVQNPGGNEQFFGLNDDEAGISFIPVFLEKETALQCFINMPREAGEKYEAQAIRYEYLADQVARNGFVLYVLDGDGQVLYRGKP